MAKQQATAVLEAPPETVERTKPVIHELDLERLLGVEGFPMVDAITPALEAAYFREQRKHHQTASGALPITTLVKIVAEVTGQRVVLPGMGKINNNLDPDEAADVIPRNLANG